MNRKLRNIVESYMCKVPDVKIYCDRCLRTERWDGNPIAMLVDASFTSIGLNYFYSVVPGVQDFIKIFIQSGRIRSFEDLTNIDTQGLTVIWKNKRSWHLAKSVAAYFTELKKINVINDRQSFILWAKISSLERWQDDPVGKIKGVGINTYQYLRMMGGIDTIMPDKIVKRVINNMLLEAGEEIPTTEMDFIKMVEYLGQAVGYRPIELCWMTWLVQSESNIIRLEKYSNILSKI